MQKQPELTIPQMRQHLARAQRQLYAREWSTSGAIYRDFAEPLGAMGQYLDQQEARRARVLDSKVLMDGARILRAVEDCHLLHALKEIAQLEPSHDDDRRFRVTLDIAGLGPVSQEGSAHQLARLLRAFAIVAEDALTISVGAEGARADAAE